MLNAARSLTKRALLQIGDPVLRKAATAQLIRRTDNLANVTWMGQPIWQNPSDAWLLQESIVELGVDMVIECGTNRGGSALYMATIFDLLGRGSVLSIDIERLHDVRHPRVEFLIGSSTSDEVVADVKDRIAAAKPDHLLVLLDSDHSATHVREELRRYSQLVPIGDYLYVQDTIIDELPRLRSDRPGPMAALRDFLASTDCFEVDEARSSKYVFSHSPHGWLRRVR